MKLKYTGIIEVEPSEDNPGGYIVTKGTGIVPDGKSISLEYIRENFTPGDCEALNMIDPDRTERLCSN